MKVIMFYTGDTMLNKPEIKVSIKDYERIYELLDRLPKNAVIDRLEEELGRAEIIETALMPDNVVEMHSRVKFKILSSGQSFTYNLVYPNEVQNVDDLSVLAPIGSAILGLSLNDEIEWPLENGKSTQVRIEMISMQKKR